MKQLKFAIRTLSPVIMSSMSNSTVMTATHSEFGGSLVRGVLASRFIDMQKLANVHKDRKFLQLFYGGLKFLPATPDCNGARSFVLPLSLQRAKAGSQTVEVQDLLTTPAPKTGYKSLRGYGVVSDGKIQTVDVRKNIVMHISRGSDAERLAGKSNDGLIFNYESLNEGQVFDGVILGEGELLRQLLDGLQLQDNEMTAHIGRSHFTQYGRCRITFDEIEELETPHFDGRIFLRLETPLLSSREFFLNARDILQSELVNRLEPKIFALGEMYGAGTEIENFVVPWSMKRPRVMAIAAGSVFELKTSRPPTKEELIQLNVECHRGFGVRTEEGFGQLRFWQSGEFVNVEASETPRGTSIELSKETIRLAKEILINRCLEQIRLDAHKDAKQLSGQLKHIGNLTHFFGRLDGLVRSAKSSAELANRIEEEMRDGSLFEQHIKDIKMSDGKSIFDVLTRKVEFRIETPKLPSELLNELRIKEFDASEQEKFFLEYMRNYFRFARKFAAAEGSDEK